MQHNRGQTFDPTRRSARDHRGSVADQMDDHGRVSNRPRRSRWLQTGQYVTELNYRPHGDDADVPGRDP